MALKVQMVREPVKAYDKTRFEVNIPNTDFGWKLRFTEDQVAELKKRLTGKIEDRKDWIHILYEEVWDKMKSVKPKLEKFNTEWLKHTEEVLIAFCQKLREFMELDKIKPKQKALKVPK